MIRRNTRLIKEQRKRDCDRCGFAFNEADLHNQDGLKVYGVFG